MDNLVWLVVLLPLAGWLVSYIAVVPRRSAQICLVFCSASAVIALVVLANRLGHQSPQPHESVIGFWDTQPVEAATFPATLNPMLGIRVDGLSSVLVALTALLSVLVQWHGMALLRTDPELRRFFQVMAMLTFALLGAVVSPNLFQLWLMWGIMAVAAHVLVAHWWTSSHLAAASRRMFMYLFAGDLALLGALVFGFVKLGRHAAAQPAPPGADASDPFSFAVLSGSPADPARAGEWHLAHLGGIAGVGPRTLALMAVLLLVAAAVRAAQLPAHGWLLEAAGAPATAVAMLAALAAPTGVLLLARVQPLFLEVPHAMTAIAVLGAATAVYAAAAALLERDLVRLGLLSSATQMGLVTAGIGMGGFSRPLFALTVTALLTALYFVVAGNIIRVYRSRDIDEIRGMFPRMRWSSLGLGVWAAGIAGAGLAGYNVLASVLHNAAPDNAHRSTAVGVLTGAAVAVSLLLSAVCALRLLRRLCTGDPPRRRGVQPERITEPEPRLRRAVALLSLVILVVVIAGALPATGFGRFVYAGSRPQVLDFQPLAALLCTVVAGAAAAVAWRLEWIPTRLPGLDLPPALARAAAWPPALAGRLAVAVDARVVDTLGASAGEVAALTGAAADRTPSRHLGVQLGAALGLTAVLAAGAVLAATGHLPVHL